MLPDERTLAEATAFYQSKGYDGAKYVGLDYGYPVYCAWNEKEANGNGTGLPYFIKIFGYGNMRELNPRETLAVMDSLFSKPETEENRRCGPRHLTEEVARFVNTYTSKKLRISRCPHEVDIATLSCDEQIFLRVEKDLVESERHQFASYELEGKTLEEFAEWYYQWTLDWQFHRYGNVLRKRYLAMPLIEEETTQKDD